MTQATSRPAPVARATASAPGFPASGRAGLGPVLPPAGPPAGARSRARSVARTVFEGSPGRIRLAGIAAVLACLVFAVLGAAAFQARGNALKDANADVAQRIRVQQIVTEVVRADSLLTSAFPSPAQETADQVADFNTALSNAAQLVAEGAAANPADGADLAAVSDALGQYRQYATSARIFNKEGLQVGFGYLRQAGAALRGQDQANNPNLITGTGMLPALDKLIAANARRVDDAYTASGWATAEMVLADLLALGGLLGVQIWLAKRTRRYLNLPLVAAGIAVLVVAVAGAIAMVGAQSRANDVRDTSYTALKSLADARIAANAAKSDASISFLYLRTGGSFATYQADYKAKISLVEQSLRTAGSAADASVSTNFATWRAAADSVFGTSQEDWPKAAAAMAQAGGPFNQPFTNVDQALQAGIEKQARDVDTGLGNGTLPLVVLTWIALGVGLIAAVSAWAGIAQRLEDYR